MIINIWLFVILTLLQSEDFMQTSHANVLVFDTRRKTVERF